MLCDVMRVLPYTWTICELFICWHNGRYLNRVCACRVICMYMYVSSMGMCPLVYCMFNHWNHSDTEANLPCYWTNHVSVTNQPVAAKDYITWLTTGNKWFSPLCCNPVYFVRTLDTLWAWNKSSLYYKGKWLWYITPTTYCKYEYIVNTYAGIVHISCFDAHVVTLT